MSKYGYTYRQAMEKINYGGLKIYSAANLDVQKRSQYRIFKQDRFR